MNRISSTARRVTGAAILAVLCVVAFSAVAAAQVEPAVSLADTVIQVQAWPEAEPNATILIVGIDVPTSTPLPTAVELPLPPNATVQWVGEIAPSGNPADDLPREWEVVETEAGQAVRFTVEQFSTIQYEASMPPVVVQNGRSQATLTWVQSVASAGISMAWRIPPGADDVQLSPDAPGTPATNEAGERLYTLQTVSPPVGDTLTFQASYTRLGTTADTGGGGLSIVTVLLGIVVVAVVILVIVIVREQRQRAELAESNDRGDA